ncbi:MAG: DUF3000 domain-containing protein [Propionibacteriaceae bacterium]|nr:DUF3000 domain-containing protein [Propionibacteriaceae bacterium]
MLKGEAAWRFADVTSALEAMRWRPEVTPEEIPAPIKIAPYAAAISAVAAAGTEELANGRLVLLHDPAGNPSWDGTFRCVGFIQADVDAEMAADPLLTEVGWSWLIDALERQHASYLAPSGTVTSVNSRAFGGMEGDPFRGQIEIRASWTPSIVQPEDILAHVKAWEELLCFAAGLPPLPADVLPLTKRFR